MMRAGAGSSSASRRHRRNFRDEGNDDDDDIESSTTTSRAISDTNPLSLVRPLSHGQCMVMVVCVLLFGFVAVM